MYDITLDDYPRLPGETDDSPRILRAVDDCYDSVLYIPRGVYEIASPIKIGNFCSLLMHKSAVLRAVKEMDFVIEWDGGEQYNDLIVYDRDGNIFDDANLFISGGDIDGAGLASCLRIGGYHHFTLKDITLHNGKKYGLCNSGNHGYELIATNVYAKCTISGLSGNVGIYGDMCDSHYTDCVVVDYTTGVEMRGSSNRLTRCHVWGGIVKPKSGFTQEEWCEVYRRRRLGVDVYDQKAGNDWATDNLPEMLIDSCCFRIRGGSNVLTGCFGDTGKTGFEIHSATTMDSCGVFNNFRFGMAGDLAIDHKGGDLYILNCDFRKCTPTSELYHGDTSHLHVVNTRTAGYEFPRPEN